MIELIRLEWRKKLISGSIRSAIGAMCIVMALLVLLVFIGEWEKEPIISSLSEWLRFADILVRSCFIIFAAVLISKLVVSEYTQNTVQLLFSYPVTRKKIMYAKLLIVIMFTFSCILLSNLLIGAGIIAVNHIWGFVEVDIALTQWPSLLLIMLIQAVGTAGISCLPIIIAMRKKTTPATIISSIIVVLIVCSDNTGFSLVDVWAVTLVLGAIGAIGAWLSMRRVDVEDVG